MKLNEKIERKGKRSEFVNNLIKEYFEKEK
jgi:metal-responsive CopG/Arc/MetJ family transcriptional regulator